MDTEDTANEAGVLSKTANPIATQPNDAPPRSNRNTNWGVFAYITLGLFTIALFWALLLNTILVNRSGQTTAQALELIQNGQQSRQHDYDQLNQQLDQTRTTAQQDLAATRRQAGTSTSTIAQLSENSSRAWQDIAKSSNQNLASASQRRLDLLQSALDQSQARQQAATTAAAVAVERAQRRQAASDAAVRAALKRAQQQQGTAQAVRDALRQARLRAQTDRDALLTGTRTALEVTAAVLDEQRNKIQARYDELHLLSPADPQLTKASTALAAAGRLLRQVDIERHERLTPQRTGKTAPLLQRVRQELAIAEGVLEERRTDRTPPPSGSEQRGVSGEGRE